MAETSTPTDTGHPDLEQEIILEVTEPALEQVLADSPQEASYKIYRNRNLLVVRNSREKLRLVEQIVRVFRVEYLGARFLADVPDDLMQLV